MKKVLLSLVTASLLIAPVAVLATHEAAPLLEICCGPTSVIVRIMNWLFTILLIVAAVFIIVAAFMFVTAQGDPEKTKTARNFVLYAVIGVLVAFAARGLVYLVRVIVTP